MPFPNTRAFLRRAALFATLLLASAGMAPTLARADVSDTDKGTARKLTIDGFAALDKKDYGGAADLFRRADSLFHAPMITLGYARAEVGLGHLVSAQELYNRLAHEPVPAGASATVLKAVEDGKDELRQLEARIPFVVITVVGGDAPVVTVDGAEVPRGALGVKRPVDPGDHVVTATAEGFSLETAKVTVAESRTQTVELVLRALPLGAISPVDPPPDEPAPPPVQGAPPTGSSFGAQRVAGLVIGGAGLASLVVAGVTGGIALGGQADAGACKPTGNSLACNSSGFEQQSSARDLAWASTATMVIGGALAATGLVVFLTAPAATEVRRAVTARLRLTPAGVAVEGGF